MNKHTTSLTIPSQLDRAHTALVQASTDFERLMIRDQAKAYEAAAKILKRRDIQKQASILVQDAERAVSKANPPKPEGRPGHTVVQDNGMSESVSGALIRHDTTRPRRPERARLSAGHRRPGRRTAHPREGEAGQDGRSVCQSERGTGGA